MNFFTCWHVLTRFVTAADTRRKTKPYKVMSIFHFHFGKMIHYTCNVTDFGAF